MSSRGKRILEIALQNASKRPAASSSENILSSTGTDFGQNLDDNSVDDEMLVTLAAEGNDASTIIITLRQNISQTDQSSAASSSEPIFPSTNFVQKPTPAVSAEGDASSVFLQNEDINLSDQPSDNEQDDSMWQPANDSSSSSSVEHLLTTGPSNPNTEAKTKLTRKLYEIASVYALAFNLYVRARMLRRQMSALQGSEKSV